MPLDGYLPYLLALFLSATLTFSLTLYAWSHRDTPGAVAFFWMMVGATGWSLFAGLILLSRTPGEAMLLSKIWHTFIAIVPLAWLAFALNYTGRADWLQQPLHLVSVAAIPALMVLFAWVDQMHHLLISDLTFYKDGAIMLWSVSFKPLFYVQVIYSYMLVFTGVILVGQSAVSTFRPYRWQAFSLILGALAPVLGSIPATFNHSILSFTPVGLAFTGLVFALALFRFQLLDLKPVARNALVDLINDPMLVIDDRNRIVDLNPASARMLGRPVEEMIGKPAERSLYLWEPVVKRLQFHADRQEEISLHIHGEKRQYDLHLAHLGNHPGGQSGRLIVLHDITEHNQLLEKMRHLAITDALTGLHNRRHFFTQMQRVLENCRRYRYTFSLIMLDIDNFKAVNDSYGHAVGDEVLQIAASTMKLNTRPMDILARYGGEEFIISLPESTPVEAFQVAKRICGQISGSPVTTSRGDVPVTISAGVAGTLDASCLSLKALITWADRALYAAKRAGRNHIGIWQTDTTRIDVP
jgi:diguanylate cyclase (GGDEF)-like protein/PAS domain S-box-containing protein